MTQTLVIGVDGGGTKTLACLAAIAPGKPPTELGRGTAGSSNLRAVGSEVALANLTAAIQDCWQQADRTPEPVAAAAFALAGAGQAEVQSQIETWAREQSIAGHVCVVHDARAALMAGCADGWGVALVAGTGAVAFAENTDGKQAVCGGWGYWFGDEGSAYWIGQSALRAVSHHADGRGPETNLTQHILAKLKIDDPREILATLSQTGDVRLAIAGLAELVARTADQGDPVAKQLLEKAALHLGNLVRTAAARVDLGASFPLALAGGVLCNCDRVREALLQELALHKLQITDVQHVGSPVDGCIKIAAQLARAAG